MSSQVSGTARRGLFHSCPAIVSVLVVSTGLVFLASSGAPAFADELQELKAQFEALQERTNAQLQALQHKIEQLETQQQAAPVAAETPEKMVSSGNENIRLEVSGQVNRAVLYVDDGDQDEVFHVDNDNSSTRVRLVGSGRLSDDVSAGALFEVQFESNSSASVDIDQAGEAGPNNFTERHLTAYLDSKRFGRLWLGQGDTASNGTSEVDLSGTGVIAYSGIEDLAGGISFKNAATSAKLVTIGGAYNQFDGLGRRDRVRYDTPTINGFKLSGSHIQGDAWDVAVRYGADYEAVGTKVSAALGYAEASHRFGFDQVNGSISLLHESGVNLTFAAGERSLDGRATGDDPLTYYVKAGYQLGATSLGKTALSLDYGQADDLAQDGDEFRTWGIFGVQKIDKLATELYFGYRNHELDRPGVSIDDIDSMAGGARLKF